jgi:putative transcription factor
MVDSDYGIGRQTLLRCEICGEEVAERGTMIDVEGAKLFVCWQCRKFGEEVKRRPSKPSAQSVQRSAKTPVQNIRRTVKPRVERVRETRQASPELELVEDYPQRIRRARESLNLTQEDLAKRIGERLSIVQKLETGKMWPSDTLVEKLGRILRLTLRAPVEEESVPHQYKRTSSELTIGDIAEPVDKKKAD